MTIRSVLLGVGATLSPVLLVVAQAQAPISINSTDMFAQAGQYFRAHGNKGDVEVAGKLGTAGGQPQAWDFTTGPEEVGFRFDYLAATNSPNAGEFPEATLVERKTDEGDGGIAWMFLDQTAGQGRMNYGFVDPAFSDSHPVSVFKPSIRDFPDSFSYGDSWSVSTTFESAIGIPDLGGGDGEDPGGGIFDIPMVVTYSASAKVDAFGILNQSGIGFGDCLRVNELAQYDIAVDLGLGDGLQTISTQYVRNYYWFRKGRGIAVQVSSKQQDLPPPDDFPVAAAVVRMFETNHPDGTVDKPGIKELRMTLSKSGALFTWAKATGVTSYRLEYSIDPGNPGNWQLLKTTGANFVIDDGANASEAPIRFYRVVGVN